MYISASVPFYGLPFRHNIATQEFTAEDFATNVMLWMYTPTLSNLNLQGVFTALPGASIVFDDYAVSGVTFENTFYLLAGSELVPRQSRHLTFTSAYLLGGRVRVDGSYASLVNPVGFDPAQADVQLTGTYEISVYFDVDIYALDRLGNPVSGATVEVYDSQGSQACSCTTDDQGHVSARLQVYHYYSDGTTTERTDYNPFTVVVKIGGGELARGRILVTGRQTFYVTPGNIYTMTTRPAKTFIQLGEPVQIVAVVRAADGSPVTGLAVEALIERPDGSSDTLQLDEASPGVYSALYTGATVPGDYSYTVTASFSGGLTLQASNTFGVGRIELALQRLSAKLDAYRWTL